MTECVFEVEATEVFDWEESAEGVEYVTVHPIVARGWLTGSASGCKRKHD